MKVLWRQVLCNTQIYPFCSNEYMCHHWSGGAWKVWSDSRMEVLDLFFFTSPLLSSPSVFNILVNNLLTDPVKFLKLNSLFGHWLDASVGLVACIKLYSALHCFGGFGCFFQVPAGAYSGGWFMVSAFAFVHQSDQPVCVHCLVSRWVQTLKKCGSLRNTPRAHRYIQSFIMLTWAVGFWHHSS